MVKRGPQWVQLITDNDNAVRLGYSFRQGKQGNSGIGNNLRIHGAACALAYSDSVGSCDQINGSRSTLSIRAAAGSADTIEQETFPGLPAAGFYAIAVITDIAVKI